MERVPKNIRQIGGREERVKTYLEDYVSTYLRKLQEEREENGAVGVLAGRWETEEGPHCVFINGAAEMRGAETGGGRLRVTEDAWNSVYESLGTYFSGQDLCGIFLCVRDPAVVLEDKLCFRRSGRAFPTAMRRFYIC